MKANTHPVDEARLGIMLNELDTRKNWVTVSGGGMMPV